MPASNETVPNRPLSGSELREIILKDIANILSLDGMFSPTIAYSRAAYDIRVRLHIDNPLYPEHVTRTESRQSARNETDPKRRAIESVPLKNTTDAVVAAVERSRSIDSPNQARLEHGLPVTISRRDGDGQIREVGVVYDTTGLDVPAGKVSDTDLTSETENEWGG